MFPGHKIRHAMCERYKSVDYYGTKFEYIPTKDMGMKHYMFSVAIENSSVPNYFTEKIIDMKFFIQSEGTKMFWECFFLEVKWWSF